MSNLKSFDRLYRHAVESFRSSFVNNTETQVINQVILDAYNTSNQDVIDLVMNIITHYNILNGRNFSRNLIFQEEESPAINSLFEMIKERGFESISAQKYQSKLLEWWMKNEIKRILLINCLYSLKGKEERLYLLRDIVMIATPYKLESGETLEAELNILNGHNITKNIDILVEQAKSKRISFDEE